MVIGVHIIVLCSILRTGQIGHSRLAPDRLVCFDDLFYFRPISMRKRSEAKNEVIIIVIRCYYRITYYGIRLIRKLLLLASVLLVRYYSLYYSRYYLASSLK